MPTIIGIDRHQITFTDLESRIANDNKIHFIDAFVDKLDMKHSVSTLVLSEKKKAGRASFENVLFLKTFS